MSRSNFHYIPGYTGHLPQNRERFGVNYREASAATIANPASSRPSRGGRGRAGCSSSGRLRSRSSS